MNFKLTKEQEAKFETWHKEKGDMIDKVGAAGGAYTFCFTHTGLGIIETVKCVDGTELDLTDWDNW